jgi:hypothetical protein
MSGMCDKKNIIHSKYLEFEVKYKLIKYEFLEIL